jgi:hypothetical protein
VQTMVANPEQITSEQIRDLAALQCAFLGVEAEKRTAERETLQREVQQRTFSSLRCLKRAGLTPIDRRELANWVHGSVSAALRDNHLSAHPLDSMLLPRNDDSEARWRRSRRFSLRVRSRPPITSTKPSSVNLQPWRP